MKYISIAISLFMLLILSAGVFGAGFTKIDVGTEAEINKIVFANDYYGYAVTSTGQLLSTFDGGKTWKAKEVSSRKINDIDMLDKVGYLAGDKGLLMKTTNGGATWQDMSMALKYNFSAVAILNDTIAFVCGTDQNSIAKTRGEFFATYDNGKTWKRMPHYGNGYTDLDTYPPRKVYLLAIKKEFHSIDWGQNYFHCEYEGDRLGYQFDFIDAWGYMVGSNGLFSRSTDHGRHWDDLPISLTKDLFAVQMFDKTSGVAAGQDGVVLFFYDNGDKTIIQDSGFKDNLKTVCAAGDKVFFGGQNGTMFYINKSDIPKPENEMETQKTGN